MARVIHVRARPVRAKPSRMRPEVDAIVIELLARHRAAGRVHLNDIDEVLGARAFSYDEVEHIVACLEAEGLTVGEPPDEAAVAVMREVLASARRLRSRQPRPPTVDEIAADSGHPAHVVRRALESLKSAGPRPPLAGLIALPPEAEPE